jgi:pilus assembly protein CpaD
VAETKPCGDWSENLRANQFNESGTAFGCAVQQNFAAMVTNPEDFVEPPPQTPTQSATQNPALERYNNGTWTAPTSDSSF